MCLRRETLQKYTVTLQVADEFGTGFFVGERLILTCRHVVKMAIKEGNEIQVQWQDRFYTAQIYQLPDCDVIDLALLQLNEFCKHLTVQMDEVIDPEEKLFTFGYTSDYPQGEPRDFTYIGLTGGENPFITFKWEQVKEGFSGSPLLNLRTGKVCGIINRSRDVDISLGGRAISVTTIYKFFPELKTKKIAKNPFYPTSGEVQKLDKIFGREKEIKDIFEILNSGSSVAIIGTQGIGKSTLLWAISQESATQITPFRKSIYLRLGSIQSDEEFYWALCNQVGIPPVGDKPLKGFHLSLELEKHRILLLMDVAEEMS
jgi:hypothetical protein